MGQPQAGRFRQGIYQGTQQNPPIIGATIIINVRNTLSTTTTVMTNLRTEAKTTLKVKELAYIKLLIPLPITTMIFTSLNPLILSLNLVKIILLYYPFLFRRCSQKLLLNTGAEKSIFSSNFILRHNLPTFPTKTNHSILADDSKVAVTAESF